MVRTPCCQIGDESQYKVCEPLVSIVTVSEMSTLVHSNIIKVNMLGFLMVFLILVNLDDEFPKLPSCHPSIDIRDYGKV